MLDALVGDTPGDGKPGRALAELEVDRDGLGERSIVVYRRPQDDAEGASRIALPMPREIAPIGGDHLPFDADGFGRNLDPAEEIARRKRVADGERGERDAERGVTGTLCGDGDGASYELGIAAADEAVTAMRAGAVFDDGHVAIGAGRAAFERTAMFAHGRLHELRTRAGAPIGKGELVAAATSRRRAEPSVPDDRVRRGALSDDASALERSCAPATMSSPSTWQVTQATPSAAAASGTASRGSASGAWQPRQNASGSMASAR